MSNTIANFFGDDEEAVEICSYCQQGSEAGKLFPIAHDKFGHTTLWVHKECAAQSAEEEERKAQHDVDRGEWQAQEDYI